MNEQELLADCLRRLNRAAVSYLKHWSQELELASALDRLLSGEIKPKNT